MGAQIQVRAVISAGGLQAQDLAVELYHGPLDERGEISNGQRTLMPWVKARADGNQVFVGIIATTCSGSYGYNVRILPQNEDMGNSYEMRLITWAGAV